MASKRRLRRNACEGKQQHPTREAALDHAGALWRHADGGVMAYYCKFGNHWHVGHPTGRQKQGLAARKRSQSL